MKDITDSFKGEIEWNIDLEKKSGDTIIQKINIEILKNLKYFEVDSITDLKNNYDDLSKLSLIELSLKNNDDKNYFLGYMRNVVYNDKHFNLIGCYSDDLDSWQINMSLNLVKIDVVNLEITKRIEEESFRALELNIKDGYDEIEGVFVYFNKMSNDEDNNTSREQMEELISFPLDDFDIDCRLFSENTKIGNTGYTHQSGEKLYILDIWGSGKRDKEEEHTPTGSNVSSSPVVLV